MMKAWTGAALAAAMAAGAAAAQAPDARADQAAAPIRFDQLGFAPGARATFVIPSAGTTPLAWRLLGAGGRQLAAGTTIVAGDDRFSGERLHRVTLTAPAAQTGLVLRVGPYSSRPFAVAPHRLAPLARDAMGFFYQQRASTPIRADLVERPDLARPAGHAPDVAACFKGRDEAGLDWPGCSYRIDGSRGWYDAGDQGKYVVNAGVSVWTLLNLAERGQRLGQAAFPDGSLRVPERGNGVSDLLDEVRWELDFLLAMQIPDGTRFTLRRWPQNKPGPLVEVDAGGLVHHKLADAHWTGLPTAPADDREPRLVFPPTTAATLNLAAVAAQAARVWKTVDPAFAAKCLASARRAFAAAGREPDLKTSNFTGSGGYGDPDVSDERFWAAAELFATTGEAPYLAVLRASPHFAVGRPRGDIGWGSLATAGAITLATVPGALPRTERAAIAASLVATADARIAEGAGTGYALPYAPEAYSWGSNSDVLNRALLLGVAYDLTDRSGYREGVADAMDYILGRNPLDRSFVTGFGARPMLNPHHRFWAHQADPRTPRPPAGVISGGPNNSAFADPVSATLKGKCAPQTCWIDDYRAFAMNEVAINWNAPLVWVASFLDATEGAPARSASNKLARGPGA